MLSKEEIAVLIDLCKRNDRRAQKVIYNSYHARYFTLCLRYLGCEKAASESVNETFFKVFTKIDKLKDPSLFEGWMKRICINTCLNQIKKNKQNQFVDLEFSSHLFVHDTNNDALSKLSVEELLELVNRLPVQMKNVFNLYAIDGYRHNEIAEQLDISIGASKFHLHQARKRLQEMISLNEPPNLQTMNNYG